VNVKLYFELDAIVCKLKPENLFTKRLVVIRVVRRQVFHSMGCS